MPNFYDLPRELRDMIYEQYILDVIEAEKTWPKCALVALAPLLLCHGIIGYEATEVSKSPKDSMIDMC